MDRKTSLNLTYCINAVHAVVVVIDWDRYLEFLLHLSLKARERFLYIC